MSHVDVSTYRSNKTRLKFFTEIEKEPISVSPVICSPDMIAPSTVGPSRRSQQC
jgi:hypothetical protein